MTIPVPREVEPLVALLGEPATLALLDAHAGIRIKIPTRVTDRSALARQIGLEAATRLAAEYGGERLYVPMAKRWRIAHLRQQGLSYAAIARRLGTSEMTVHDALVDAGLTRQLSLPF